MSAADGGAAAGGGAPASGGGGDELDTAGRMMENYVLLKAAMEQQNQGGFDAMCM
jgi:hypothetical protein